MWNDDYDDFDDYEDSKAMRAAGKVAKGLGGLFVKAAKSVTGFDVAEAEWEIGRMGRRLLKRDMECRMND